MNAGNAIYGKLSTTAAVTALVDDRIYPEIVPDDPDFLVYPLIVYKLSDPEYDRTYSGRTGLVSCVVDVATMAKTFTGAQQLAEIVVAALDNGSGTWGGVTVDGCFIDNQDDEPISTDAGQDTMIYLSELSFTLWFRHNPT